MNEIFQNPRHVDGVERQGTRTHFYEAFARFRFTSLRTLFVVALLTLFVLPAHAQTATQSRVYAIPAGSLTAVLNRFAEESGFLLTAPGELTEGQTSTGLNGLFTVEQGLRSILAGSGLQYRFDDAGVVSLVAVTEQTAPIQLDAIVVQGWRTTELQGFRPQRISSALKTDEAIADTPASVSVVTRDVIEAQGARSVTDALRNVPGVTPGPNPGNISVQQEFNIRGFESSLISVNGVERRSTGLLSLANVESIEVLKGPFSILYGDLVPGGFINVQTKRPQRTFGAEIVGGIDKVVDGRGMSGTGSVDVTGPIDEAGTFLYRFIASADGGAAFIDDVDNERFLVAPSLSYVELDGDLRIDVELSYLRNEETFQYGFPARDGRPDQRLDFDTFFGSENSEKESEDYSAEIRGDWQVTDSTSIDAALSWHDYDLSAVFLDPGSLTVAPDDTISRRLGAREVDSTDLQFEANLTHEVTFVDADWRFLVGGDIRKTDVSSTDRNINDFDRTSVFSPNNAVDLPPVSTIPVTYEYDDETIAWGLYGQAEVWLFDRLKLLGGFRYDDIEYDYADNFPNSAIGQRDTQLSPRTAALFKLTPSTAVYGSYSTSFQQEVQFTQGEPSFDPTEGEQVEFGLKQEFFDGRALATIAVFDLTQRNIVQPGPTAGTTVQIGEAQTRGLEVEISGEVIDGLRVIGGYSYLDAEIAEATDGSEGNRLANTPEHAASLFATYDIVDRGSERLTVGGGAFYQGERFTSSSNAVTLPDFVTVDLMGEYASTAGSVDFRARVGVRNLFDEEIFINGDGDGIAFRAQPRALSLELGVKF